jgi:hypothetical protein
MDPSLAISLLTLLLSVAVALRAENTRVLTKKHEELLNAPHLDLVVDCLNCRSPESDKEIVVSLINKGGYAAQVTDGKLWMKIESYPEHENSYSLAETHITHGSPEVFKFHVKETYLQRFSAGERGVQIFGEATYRIAGSKKEYYWSEEYTYDPIEGRKRFTRTKKIEKSGSAIHSSPLSKQRGQ